MKVTRTALTALLLAPVVCHAMLGGAPSKSTHPLPAALQASPGGAGSSAYTVHQAQGADGVTLREYASAANVVFAVTWQGPVRPDMQALLGSYFPNFVAAGRRHARGTGPLIERDGDVRIESAGHPGAFVGKAYVPRLVPPGVKVEALQ